MRIRAIIISARDRPPEVTVSTQNFTSTSPSWVKNRFSTPVKIRIITRGFMPRRMDLSGMVDNRMTTARKMNTKP